MPDTDLLPGDAQRQMRKIQFAVKQALDAAVADCPDVDAIHVDLKIRLRPLNQLITIKVENKD